MDTSNLNDAQRRGLDILANVAEKPVDEIERDHEMVADLGVDSPRALQFLLDLEEELDLEIADEDAAGMDTVADVLDYLGRL